MILKQVFKAIDADGHGILVSKIFGDKGDCCIKIRRPII
jgi:hypothetical protein